MSHYKNRAQQQTSGFGFKLKLFSEWLLCCVFFPTAFIFTLRFAVVDSWLRWISWLKKMDFVVVKLLFCFSSKELSL